MKDEDSHPIFFEGTDPRRRGFPLPEDESDVGKPREQFERALRCEDPGSTPQAWYRYLEEKMWDELE